MPDMKNNGASITNEETPKQGDNHSTQNYTKKILIVEDNPINRQILTRILEDDYIVLEAENGQQALDILEESWDEISLILLDLIMPVMDGYTFLSIVKDHRDFSTIPIIVTTSNDSEKDEVNALASGATDFVRKPYHWQIVKHRVKSIITLRETAAMFNFIKFDQLTGLYSKEYFYKVASQEIEHNPDKFYDVIACDVENFSLVNDSYGYDTGNEILRIIGDVLSTHVPNVIYCTRMDSDIFMLLLPSRNDYSAEFFDSITSEINQRVNRNKIELDFGIYHISKDENVSIYTASNRALSVIEKIKGKFTSNFAFYDDEFQQEKFFAQKITANMEGALKNREFSVYYQPKFDLNTERMIGAEALIRWISPTEGFMSPGMFIPLFEKNGFISELDKFVWEEACIFLRKSIDAGLPLLPISVNVSRTDLYSLDVLDVVTKLVEKYDLEPENLHLEITESAYTDDPELILGLTKRLHDKGFIIEMDDFGTGYSSLNILSEMTLDTLKLDMSFVQNHMENKKQSDIVYFIIDLAKRMKLAVISEGVESAEQAENLRLMGCNQAQGFYFAKPVKSEEYWKLLEDFGEELKRDKEKEE